MTLSTPWPAVPSPVAALLARLPAFPGSVLMAHALNRGLAPQLPPDVQHALCNKRFRVEVIDARLIFDFSFGRKGFVAGGATLPPDLIFRAAANDYLRMARRLEDPDTLFFSRRLVMEGDTELGLIVKNTLDALEGPLFTTPRWVPAARTDRHE